jgi:hypothetical protein
MKKSIYFFISISLIGGLFFYYKKIKTKEDPEKTTKREKVSIIKKQGRNNYRKIPEREKNKNQLAETSQKEKDDKRKASRVKWLKEVAIQKEKKIQYRKEIESHFKEPEIPFNDEQYHISDDLQAVPKKIFKGDRSQIYREMGPFFIIKLKRAPKNIYLFGKNIVYNKKKKTMGIITGRFFVSLKKNFTIQDLESRLKLKVLYKKPEKNFYYLKPFKKIESHQKKLLQIKNDRSVSSVRFEIKESFNRSW